MKELIEKLKKQTERELIAPVIDKDHRFMGFQSNVVIITHEEAKQIIEALEDIEPEPYMGWCDVEGCQREGSNMGSCWRKTGYWVVCSEHANQWRNKNPQPQMKQSAIDREASRDKETGYLPGKFK